MITAPITKAIIPTMTPMYKLELLPFRPLPTLGGICGRNTNMINQNNKLGMQCTSTERISFNSIQIELSLKVLVFLQGEISEYPEKKRWVKNQNQQQTQSTRDTESGIRTWATLLGGECPH